MPIQINQGMLDQITGDTSDGWDDAVITFSIDVDPGTTDLNPFSHEPDTVGTSANNKKAILEALMLWDDVMARGLAYSPNNDDADITINTADNLPANVSGVTLSTLHTILPNDADVFITPAPIKLGNSAWTTVLHEFGHALGLQHPGDYDASDSGSITYAKNRTYDQDTVQFSIMSYFDPNNYNPGINWSRANGPQTPMIYDILAIQRYYGVDTTTRTGDTTYGFNSNAGRSVFDFNTNTTPVLTIWDAGGIDTLDLSGFAADQRISLDQGSYSDVGGYIQNVGIAFGTWIENAIGGSKKDLMVGNKLDNVLQGNAGDDALQGNEGNDTLDGGVGADTLIGNDGNDILIGGAGDDQLLGNDGDDILTGGAGGDMLDGGRGFDIVQYDSPTGENITIRPKNAASGNWTVTGVSENTGDNLASIEGFRFGAGNDVIKTAGATASVTFDLDGGLGNDTISGGDGVDTLIGGAGTDTLDPGTGVFHVYGAERDPGGAGIGESLAQNDLLVLDHSGMATDYTLNFGGQSAVSLGMFSDAAGSTATGIARLHYTGGSGIDAINGGLGSDEMFGGAGNDTLFGNDGGDKLTGGAGDDILIGVDGNDVLLGGAGTDVLSGGDGNDRIETGGGGDYSVGGGAGNDTIIGADDVDFLDGGTGNDRIFGYGGNDNLQGDDGNDTIDGGDGDDVVDPGLGVEHVDGGKGNDQLIMGRSSQTVGVSFFLDGPAGSDGTTSKNFETLNYNAGSGNDTVQGGANQDLISGNNGADLLIGMGGDDTLWGGDGNDVLRGGLGADQLFGGNGNDRLETGGGGDVTVNGEAGNDTLIGSKDGESMDGGAGNDKLYGYGGADTLSGGDGKDLLDGGLGNDTLTGGAGNDVYLFGKNYGADLVIGFDSNAAGGQDEIDVAALGFKTYHAMLAGGLKITASGADTLLTFARQDTIVTLQNVAKATIGAADFMFT